ncbi:hypothetical protein BDD12DRAFT_842946, partial [Trichophaea hybrida]
DGWGHEVNPKNGCLTQGTRSQPKYRHGVDTLFKTSGVVNTESTQKLVVATESTPGVGDTESTQRRCSTQGTRSEPKYRHGVDTLLETFGGGQHGVNPRTMLDAGNTESTQVSSRSRYTAQDFKGSQHGVDTVLKAGNTESAQVSSRSRYTA